MIKRIERVFKITVLYNKSTMSELDARSIYVYKPRDSHKLSAFISKTANQFFTKDHYTMSNDYANFRLDVDQRNSSIEIKHTVDS